MYTLFKGGTKTDKHNQGFALILLIMGVAIVIMLLTWQLTNKSTTPGGQPRNLIQTEQKAEKDVQVINKQLLQQHPTDLIPE